MTRFAVTLVLALLVAPLATPGAAEEPPTQSEIEEALTCQCGCGLTVHSCNHLQCPSGEPMKDEIRRRLALGESRETILAAFAAKYGEKVLSSPTMRGFNWLAWITPFAVLLVAGTVVVIVVRGRLRHAPAPAPAGTPAPMDPGARARLERALSELDPDA
ncbi:MAG TPA: cytochrome c-type biogenesis protein CcmH [Candidatus Limnocylindria bacterium]|nr:cytochrome c-type biogenesis protein CcmH [Candidatus Limnocylindria bacterium]